MKNDNSAMNKLTRRTAILLPLGTLAACATPKPKILGTQLPVLPVTSGLTPNADAPAVVMPAPVNLSSWPQDYASAAHAPGNISGPTGLKPGWAVNIGQGGGYKQPLPSNVLIAEGKIFTMDADGAVEARNPADGSRLWRCVTRPKHVTAINIGGGIAYDNGIIYASTGYAELLAIAAGSGTINWRQKLDFVARSAPCVAAGIVSVICQNDLLLTFDATAGAPGWRFTGAVSAADTSAAVSGAPAFADGILVAGFSSGTLAALDNNSGTPIWEQSLASAFGQASPLDFSDIVAAPVIANGVVYAISLGATCLAIDLHSGAKVWQRDVSGNQTIAAAGDFVFVLDTDEKLAAIHADDGLVAWVLQLPPYRNMKKQSGPQSWNGPVIINSELILTSTLGTLLTVDPVAGAISSTAKLHGPADLTPVAAAGMFLQLTRDAILTSYG